MTDVEQFRRSMDKLVAAFGQMGDTAEQAGQAVQRLHVAMQATETEWVNVDVTVGDGGAETVILPSGARVRRAEPTKLAPEPEPYTRRIDLE